MTEAAKILVADDNAMNVKMLAQLLVSNGYSVVTAAGGKEALAKVASEQPDMILLDIMMPDLDGYQVCREIRANPATEVLPIVLVTALDPAKERIKGLEAGADDFLSKPIDQGELLARVRSQLRVKKYHDMLQRKTREVAELNRSLESRVAEQVAEIERMSKLKRFFSSQLAELIVAGAMDDPMKSHRREITCMFLDLRGFTTFSDTTEPEEVMSVLRSYHAEMGRLIIEYGGTLEHFAGDGMMIFFNDPTPIPEPTLQALRMALAMHQRFTQLLAGWSKLGYELGLGIGIAQGYATLGTVGFEGRLEYGAIGNVVNLAARLCGEAKPGQILLNQKTYARVENAIDAQSIGELRLKGFAQPVPAYNVSRLKS
jgi:adenylate cyclase